MKREEVRIFIAKEAVVAGNERWKKVEYVGVVYSGIQYDYS